MAWFDELAKGARLGGVAPSGPVTVIDVDRLGADVVSLTYEDGEGGVHRELVYRDSGVELAAGSEDRLWSFDADPELFLLVAEAKRISLAYLFDPYLATHSSDVDLLPHQIEAVYLDMLPHSPLRFLLADDPGAGKTIMAGLLIKELIVRGDLERCLIVVPGGLAEQWQDELGEKFGLEFELLTREMVESTRSGNPFEERHRLIARLDMLARDEGLQAHLGRTDWDLVVVDEAHKMSATHRGGDVEATKRYRLGQRLERAARHFLLMTATPHNGKPEDFQLFMALLDEDRFAGRFRRGAHSDEPPTDLMRRRVKEDLLRFDGTKLFPERVAITAKYPLDPDEQNLYEEVTAYVREGMNRAQQLRREGEGRRSAVVGFVLTILQRRLASSPRAILRSLERRRQRLSARLAEAEMHGAAARARSADPAVQALGRVPSGYRLSDFEDFDPDELLSSETETFESEILDEATAARTAAELGAEIAQLEQLERQAREVHARGADRKWDELARLLQNTPEMLDEHGRLRKLIVFTEHRDTLDYLVERLVRLLGRSDGVVSIHGGIRRGDRRQIQHRFTQDERVRILVATDAAGEGLNLQRSHLMVNYDLPWNPNRIEQRFGRIRYERVCFESDRITVAGRPRADLLSPGHPLLDAAVGAVLDAHGRLLAQGAILIDPTDAGDHAKVLVLLEHEITDASGSAGRPRRPVSRRLEYVEITEGGNSRDPGTHPYLDCRVPDGKELELLGPLAAADWARAGLERTAMHHAAQHSIPRHLDELRDRVHRRVDRTLAAVEQRLTAERNHWDNQVLKLKNDEMAGKRNARLNSAQAARHADEADDRLNRRREELARQRKLSPRPPRIVGAAFVVPEGLLARLLGGDLPPELATDTARTERLAVDAVLAVERALGRDPVEKPHNHKGYDIETRDSDGNLVSIEVKGRVAGASDFVVTASEVFAGLNKAGHHILALVEVADGERTTVRYLHDPFTGRMTEPGYGEKKRILSWPDYWNLAGPPR